MVVYISKERRTGERGKKSRVTPRCHYILRCLGRSFPTSTWCNLPSGFKPRSQRNCACACACTGFKMAKLLTHPFSSSPSPSSSSQLDSSSSCHCYSLSISCNESLLSHTPSGAESTASVSREVPIVKQRQAESKWRPSSCHPLLRFLSCF